MKVKIIEKSIIDFNSSIKLDSDQMNSITGGCFGCICNKNRLKVNDGCGCDKNKFRIWPAVYEEVGNRIDGVIEVTEFCDGDITLN
jgi:hypothetical protein